VLWCPAKEVPALTIRIGLAVARRGKLKRHLQNSDVHESSDDEAGRAELAFPR
jgi:hypothetical protein